MGCRALAVELGVQGRCRLLLVLGVSGEIGARLGGGRNVGAKFLFQEWLQ